MLLLTHILRHRRPYFLLHLLLATAMLPGLLQLKNDNSPEVFFAGDAAALKEYRDFRRDFGGGKSVRIAFKGKGIWTAQGLSWLARMEDYAASLPGVKAALGLTRHHRWLHLDWPPEDPGAFRRHVLKNNLDLGAGWVGKKGETVTMAVIFDQLPPPAIQELLDRLNRFARGAPGDIGTFISGLPVLERAMDQSLMNIAGRILPLLIFLAALFLWVVFRRAGDVAIPLFYVGIGQVLLFGMMGYLQVRLNLVNIILALLLFVISLATAVHLLVHYRRTGAEENSEPLLSLYRHKTRPVLWTGLTTLAAFGSLVTGNIPPVRILGIWSAVGMVIVTVLAFTFYPLLLGMLKPGKPFKPRPFETTAGRWGRCCAHWAVRRRRVILVAAPLTVIAALLGLSRLGIEDNLARYFSPRHPVRAGLERLQEEGIGVFALEVILSGEAGFLDPVSQQKLARLSAMLRARPLVYGAVGSGDLLEASARSLLVEGEMNDNIRWMALGMMQSAEETRAILNALVTPAGGKARITLLVPILSFNRVEPLMEHIRAGAAAVFPGAQCAVTGQYPLILMAQKKLLWGLVLSLSITLLCVLAVFLFVLRNLPLTFRMLLPNLWPVLLVLGGMGWLGIPLDSASVMTAAVVLGLAVDDTLHTLGYFLPLSKKIPPGEAAVVTLERTAPAHILTTILLTAGFIACYFSDFLPVSRTGAISAVAILLALLGDLLLIPALLGKTRR